MFALSSINDGIHFKVNTKNMFVFYLFSLIRQKTIALLNFESENMLRKYFYDKSQTKHLTDKSAYILSKAKIL